MSRERKEKPQPPVVDLAGDVGDDVDTEIIKVGRRLYRVREDILEASPQEYSQWQFGDALVERYCVVCSVQLGHPEETSPWTPPEEIRCLVHQQPDGGRYTVPHCPYCGQEMVCVLPFEVLLHQTRYVWVCEAKHCHVVSDSIEGVE